MPFIALAALLAGCSDRVMYQADVAVPDNRWERANEPEFTFDVTDTVNAHDLYIDVRHTGNYAYSNLYLFVRIAGPGVSVPVDTVECLLADPSGRWYGRGLGFIFADRFQAHVLYKLNNRFPHAGRYSVTLEQAMRDTELKGIMDVGISVERSRRKTG